MHTSWPRSAGLIMQLCCTEPIRHRSEKSQEIPNSVLSVASRFFLTFRGGSIDVDSNACRVFQIKEDHLLFWVRAVYNEDSACAFFLVRSKSQRTVFSSSCHHFAPALLNTWFIQLLGCPPSTCSGASFIHLPELFLRIIFSATLFCWHTHPS